MQSRSISKDKQTQSGILSKRQIVFLVLSVLFAIMIFCFSARNGEESTEDSYTVGMEFGRIVHPDFKNWSDKHSLRLQLRSIIRSENWHMRRSMPSLQCCSVVYGWMPEENERCLRYSRGELRRCMRRRMSFISCLFLDGADR